MTMRLYSVGWGWLSALLVFGLACSSPAPRRRDAAIGGGGTGQLAGTGAAGSAGVGAGSGGVGGTGLAGSGGNDAGLPMLSVQLLADDKPATSVTLDCEHKCFALRAAVSGGASSHVFTWSDAKLQGVGPTSVCPTKTTDYALQVDDPASVDTEFGAPAMHAQASLHVEVKSCGGFIPCDERAAAGSFDPVEKWHVDGFQSIVTPLVANLTDDNNDGKIDLSDIPDVVVVSWNTSDLRVLDGATGTLHFLIPSVLAESTPAIADIDGDGVADIVVAQNLPDLTGATVLTLGVYDHTGRLMFSGPIDITGATTAIAVADLEHDGKPEIIIGPTVYDAQGMMLWRACDPSATQSYYESAAAVDLDGDGVLEVVYGGSAYRSNGDLYFANTDVSTSVMMSGTSMFVAIADLDGDLLPEVVVTTPLSWFVLDNAGKTLAQKMIPSTSSPGYAFPPAIADIDGDGKADILVSSGTYFYALDKDLETLWSVAVNDSSGIASGTAFDFLGDGSAEAMYADEHTLWAYDGKTGMLVFKAARSSATLIEYPTVADVDNDGSADLLVVSTDLDTPALHGVQMFSDRNARWVRARRIMNQDTYHVTNINEDGTLPKQELPHYKANNSFRAQAQIQQDGTLCLPQRSVE